MGIGYRSKDAPIGIVCVIFFLACNVYEKAPERDSGENGNTSNGGGGAKTTEPVNDKKKAATEGGAGATAETIADDGGDGSGSGQLNSGDEPGSIANGCGDGLLNPAIEKCDIAITPRQTGACPITQQDCPPPQKELCLKWEFNGESGCNAACVPSAFRCGDNDGCCPEKCNPSVDSDCSTNCGNGIVEKEVGETCENDSSNPKQSCPTRCPDDDGNPCTIASLIGSAANCNAACRKVTITQPKNDDGCCPTGASALTDTDCDPVCGNRIWERGEECDGDIGCDINCKLNLSTEQKACIEKFNNVHDNASCRACMCANCLDKVVACYGSDDDALNAGCAKVVRCGYDTNCVNEVCYCGSASGVLTYMCLAPGAANGPCQPVIDEVAGPGADAYTVYAQQDNESTAIGRAVAISKCSTEQCLGVCKK